MFFENASLNGLETVSNCIEDKLNIYLKLSMSILNWLIVSPWKKI
jgi:hypothetical protein